MNKEPPSLPLKKNYFFFYLERKKGILGWNDLINEINIAYEIYVAYLQLIYWPIQIIHDIHYTVGFNKNYFIPFKIFWKIPNLILN